VLMALPPHVRDFITVAMDSGGRKGELEALTWDKIEWGDQRATLLLPASDTKAAKARRIPVTKRSTDILKRLRKNSRDAARVFSYERAGEIKNLGNVRKPFETACLVDHAVRRVGHLTF
jgi:integrase